MTERLRVTQGLAGSRSGSVHLGEFDVSDAVSGVRLELQAGELPKVELDVRVLEIECDVDGAQIMIPETTHAALVALGWTPPEGG